MFTVIRPTQNFLNLKKKKKKKKEWNKNQIKSNWEISNSCYYISCRHIELIKWSLVAAISF